MLCWFPPYNITHRSSLYICVCSLPLVPPSHPTTHPALLGHYQVPGWAMKCIFIQREILVNVQQGYAAERNEFRNSSYLKNLFSLLQSPVCLRRSSSILQPPHVENLSSRYHSRERERQRRHTGSINFTNHCEFLQFHCPVYSCDSHTYCKGEWGSVKKHMDIW